MNIEEYRQIKTKALKFLLIICILSIFGCKDEAGAGVYSLYRDSPIDNDLRIHMATFDSKNKTWGGTRETYNRENCKLAASLFQSQKDIVTTFWCEKGYFKK